MQFIEELCKLRVTVSQSKRATSHKLDNSIKSRSSSNNKNRSFRLHAKAINRGIIRY